MSYSRLRSLKVSRIRVVIASKFGLMSHVGSPGSVRSSTANIRSAIEVSLKRLDADYISLSGVE